MFTRSLSHRTPGQSSRVIAQSGARPRSHAASRAAFRPVARHRTALLASLMLIASLLAAPMASAAPSYAPRSVSATAAKEAYATFQQLLHIKPDWTGDPNTCKPGATSAAYRQATLQAINTLRELQGLQAVRFDPKYDKPAQAAALVMRANGQLSHQIPTNWKCYSPDAATGASHANLHWGSTSGPAAILSYMSDGGSHNTFVGHRRWVLFPPTTVMGTGDTGTHNALYVFGTNTNTSQAPTAWPMAGHMPAQWMTTRWSYSLPKQRVYALSDARVSVRDAKGRAMALTQHPVAIGYGNDTLTWEMANDVAKGPLPATYHVTVSGVRDTGGVVVPDIAYDVTIMDGAGKPGTTPQPTPGPGQGTDTGTDTGTDPGVGEGIPGYTPERTVRLSGSERIGTSVAVSRAMFKDGSKPYVHIATAQTFPDALVGGAAASWREGPLLLTDKDRLSPSVEHELRRLQPKAVAILGGKAVISDHVLNQITAITGSKPYRKSGSDRYATSVAIARTTYANPHAAIIVNGNVFSEAISAANLFDYASLPIFLVNPAKTEPTPDLLEALDQVTSKEVYVIQGAGRVPEGVIDNLKDKGFKVTVIDGKDAFDANLKTAQFRYTKPIPNNPGVAKHRNLYLVTGKAFPDGLAVGALIRRYTGPIIFVQDGCVNAATQDLIRTIQPKHVMIIGGTKAVPDSVVSFKLCARP